MLARDERQRARNRREGYAEGNRLVVRNEKELLDDSFLRDHCLETSVDDVDGALGARFRPIQSRRNGVDIRGEIWVDANRYQILRLELEHVRGGRAFAESRIEYANIAVDGGAFRLPSAGSATVRPSGMNRTLVAGATAALTYTYRDFQHVRSK